MDYKLLLEESFAKHAEDQLDEPDGSRLVFLGDEIFNFTTYDTGMTEFFARKAVEVCNAINTFTTFKYQDESPENYQWFLVMCNMPFFVDKLNWGTSIRGAWWDLADLIKGMYKLETCGLWQGDEQIAPVFESDEEWTKFMQAVVEFAAPEMKPEGTQSEGPQQPEGSEPK